MEKGVRSLFIDAVRYFEWDFANQPPPAEIHFGPTLASALGVELAEVDGRPIAALLGAS